MDKTKVFKSRIRNKLILILVLLLAQNLGAQNQDFSKLALRGMTEWENLIIETSLSTKASKENKNSFVTHYKIKSVEKTTICYKDSAVGDANKMYLLEYDANGLLKFEHTCYVYPGKNYLYSTCYLYNTLGFFSSKFQLFNSIEDTTEYIYRLRHESPPPLYKVVYRKNVLIKKEYFIKQGCFYRLSKLYRTIFNLKNVPYKSFHYFYNENNMLIRIEEYSENTLQKVSLFNYTYY
jgi:hypothetical protein